jgi:formylglycine-generating enzyme required for sulfatase activity
MRSDRSRAIATILSGALLLVACAGAEVEPTLAPPPTAPSALGDTRTRPADGMVMVYVPAGTFRMGSSQEDIDAALDMCQRNSGSGECLREWFENEYPQHAVKLDAFWIDRTEVTKAQYHQCVRAGRCDEVHCATGLDPRHDDQPAACVDWSHAEAYCRWAGARLPTEAEWEYAARGPDGNIFPWGDSFDPARLNYCDANCTYEWRDAEYDDGYKMTAPVGSFEAGASWCGALDMAGNAWEWVADWYEDDYYARSPASNPQGPDVGQGHVMRGGSCYYFASYVRSARRTMIFPSTGETNNSGSFRCAVSSPSLH